MIKKSCSFVTSSIFTDKRSMDGIIQEYIYTILEK